MTMAICTLSYIIRDQEDDAKSVSLNGGIVQQQNLKFWIISHKSDNSPFNYTNTFCLLEMH